MKKIALSFITIAVFGTTTMQSSNEPSKIAYLINNPNLQQALAATTTILVGAMASLAKKPSKEFLKAFGIQSILQLIPEFLTVAMQRSDKTEQVRVDSQHTINNLSAIMPLYNIQAALRSLTQEQPDLTTCGNHIKSALRNMIASYAARGCKHLGRAVYNIAITKI